MGGDAMFIGGLQIFMQTMASRGFDSLPHCGAVVAMLTITQLSHKQAYRDVGIITVVIPVVVTIGLLAVVA